MTPDELRAIRERNEERKDVAFAPRAEEMASACSDIDALLAEVDKLNGRVDLIEKAHRRLTALEAESR